MARELREPLAPAPADPAEALAPYEPGPGRPFDARHGAHLLRRAGFGGTAAEARALAALGPVAAAEALVAAAPDPEIAGLDAALDALLDSGESRDLQAWWALRMARTRAPFREKLALFLHGHFATCLRKVGSVRAMRAQAGLFLSRGAGPFGDLAFAVATDAAMLLFLDGAKSEKRRPNENLARELMELFTLGRGAYTERDVREAARALTGWRVDGALARFVAAAHDAGEKEVFGRRGALGAAEVVSACVEQPACAPFLARKLLVFYLRPDPPDPLVAAFAALLREHGLAAGPPLARLLASRAFYSKEAYRSCVRSPADFAIGTLRALGGRVGGHALAESMASMGQSLFDPPSVKGWDGGRAWIHAATWIARARFAHAAVASGGPLGREFDPGVFLGSAAGDPAAAAEAALEALLQGDAPAAARDALAERARASGGGDAALRAILQAVLLLPESHLS